VLLAKRRRELLQSDKKALQKASSEAVDLTIGRLHRYFSGKRWLSKNNRYIKNTINAIKRDKKNSKVNYAHVADYIAASCSLHCSDGWAFLGRAIDSHARGNVGAARHFAYYAELRAAMSLLATEGVGVFSRQHFLVEAPRGSQLLNLHMGTHDFAWLCLVYWSGLERCARLLKNIIRPGGVPFGDWFESFRRASVRQIGRKWLSHWGLDLKRFSQDHDARNEASYRPSRMVSSPGMGTDGTCDFLRGFWMLHDPSGFSRFEVLDRHLLRVSLKQASVASGLDPVANVAEYGRQIDATVERLNPGGLSQDDWKKFLTWRIEPELPALLVHADGETDVGDPAHHLGVIARATLLLRVATGAAAHSLSEADVARSDIEFWWRHIGEGAGIWEHGAHPVEFTDLWADVAEALGDIASWLSSTPGPTPYTFMRDRARSIIVLSTCERILLWGLGI